MSADSTLPASYFEQIYAADPDPWKFESSAYEAAKYDRTMAALGSRQFASALEIGCSIGVLTERLAARCDHLLAVDVSTAALARARVRCAGLDQVQFEEMHIPAQFPPGPFELIVVSEVGYYWSRSDLQLATARCIAALSESGVLLLVHWTDPVHDYPLTGDIVHDDFLRVGAEAGLHHSHAEHHPRYRLDMLSRSQAPR